MTRQRLIAIVVAIILIGLIFLSNSNTPAAAERLGQEIAAQTLTAFAVETPNAMQAELEQQTWRLQATAEAWPPTLTALAEGGLP